MSGSGVTVGVLSDSFDCYATYAESSSGVPASGYAGYAYNGFTATAATDVSVLVSSIGEFRSILHAVPSVEEKVRRASVARTVGVGIAA